MRLRKRQERLVEGLNRDQCVQKYLPKVRKIARHIASLMSHHAYFEDLVSTGLMGLMEAFDKFDPTKATQFSTYALFRIRGSMIDEIRNQSWAPRSVVSKSKELELVHDKFEKSLGRRATDAEISTELGLSKEDTSEFIQRATLGKVLNLDDYRSFNEKDKNSLIEKIQGSTEDIFEWVDRSKVRDLLRQTTNHLNSKQQEVIFLFYFEGLKNIEISKKMNISESRVCQLHREALNQLRRSKDISILYRCLYKNIAA